MIQDVIFSNGEGDRWFERNCFALHNGEKHDMPLRLFDQYELHPESVLKVGSSNGWRLAELKKRGVSRCVGVEPSAAAIADGKKQFSDVEFFSGTAASIPLQESFSLVIVHFVLHWVARETLLQSIAEIDRVTADEGYLLIGDFLPDTPTRRRYHHLPDQSVYTYKTDYASMFLASSLYTRVATLTFDHDQHTFSSHVSSQNRAAVTLLRKSYRDVYSDFGLS